MEIPWNGLHGQFFMEFIASQVTVVVGGGQ